MSRTGTADLIIRGLRQSDLLHFLPGVDHRDAITGLVCCMPTWPLPAWGLGETTREGIGEWDLAAGVNRTPGNAAVFLTWPEILAVIERGCADGHREAYETAYWAWKGRLAAGDKSVTWYQEPPDVLEARHALIRHGAKLTQVQAGLF